MEKGPASVRNSACSSRSFLLPPKIPIPATGQSYTEYVGHESNPHHRRTSSESLLIEKPCWFDELLDEPETSVRKGGHRRSSSDSLAYTDVSNDSKGSAEKIDSSHGKPSPSEASKCRKYPPRPRVKRQQYIAKLEGDVQALEAVTCGTSAQLEFVKQQNLIIDMENIALKGRLDSLAQEQLIKSREQEALQREVSILRALYQQQQCQRFSYRRM